MRKAGRIGVSGLLLVAGVLGAKSAAATHMIGMSMRYRVPDPVSAPTKVDVTLDFGYWPGGFLDPVVIHFSDGDSATVPGVMISSTGLETPLGLGYRVMRHSVTHTFAAGGPQWANYSGCCQYETPINKTGAYLAAAIMDLSPGTTGGPVASVPPMVFLQTGGLRSYLVGARDPDGAPITCRFATDQELGYASSPPSIPGGGTATIANDPAGCLIQWDTTGAQDSQTYLLGLAMETVKGGHKSVSTAGFAIVLTAAPPPTCNGTGVIQADLGVPFQVPFLGTSVSAGDLTLGAIGLFGALTPPVESAAPSPFTTSLSGTPSPGDEGLHAMSIVYEDAMGRKGDCSAIVEVAPCSSFGAPCQTGVGACQGNGGLYCNAGQVLCSAVAGQPSSEVCDAVDNDCDGTVDNGFVLGGACSVGVGECMATGVIACDALGGASCNAIAGQPGPEVCDGLDNDCDGTTDEGCGAGSGGQAGAGGQATSSTSGQGGMAGAGPGGQGGASTTGQGGTGGATSSGEGGMAGSGADGQGGATTGQGGTSAATGGQGGSGALGGQGGAGNGNATTAAQTTGSAGNGNDNEGAGCACEVRRRHESNGALLGLVLAGLLVNRRSRRRAGHTPGNGQSGGSRRAIPRNW